MTTNDLPDWAANLFPFPYQQQLLKAMIHYKPYHLVPPPWTPSQIEKAALNGRS